MYNAKRITNIFNLLLAVTLLFVSGGQFSSAQTTLATGSVVGVVSDPSGAVLVGARINITNLATGQVIEVTTNSG